MIYLTYGDQPSGVYSSQVIDVCNYLNQKAGANIKLVSFISLHNFNANKARIKSEFSNAVVLPMIPRMSWWWFNSIIFSFYMLLSRKKNIVTRNVIACNMALDARKRGVAKKVCFDGRGAIAAEWHEYNVVNIPSFKEGIKKWENRAVNDADYRIAVSQKLVEYWQREYNYTGSNHVIIPCTLNSNFKPILPEGKEIETIRNELGFKNNDVVLVYSGSTAGWQSFGLLKDFLEKALEKDNVKVLFLSEGDKNIDALKAKFQGRVQNKFLKHKDVLTYLSACDYGILLRENTVTNQVASPTKFAEYLSAGLKVLISENIGDYTAFTRENNCGEVLTDRANIKLEKISAVERNRMIKLITDNFTKDANLPSYHKLITYFS